MRYTKEQVLEIAMSEGFEYTVCHYLNPENIVGDEKFKQHAISAKYHLEQLEKEIEKYLKEFE